MQIITLTTDFGGRDPYVGIIKGVILNIFPYGKIVDITHEISPQDVLETSWVLESSFFYFPKGTIHVCIVDPGVGSNRKPLLLETKDYFFVGPDNGVFSGILEKEKDLKAFVLDKEQFWLSTNVSRTFHGRDVFSPVSAHLAKGIKTSDLGSKIEITNLVKLYENQFSKNQKSCTGVVKHIDRFGNILTNIPHQDLPNKLNGKIKSFSFKGLLKNYSEGEPNKLYAITGSNGHLELFVNKGSAGKLTSAKVGDKIELQF